MVTEHKTFNGGVDGLLSRLKAMADQQVLVGITSDTDREDRKKGEIGNAYLAYIQTNGSRKGPVRREMKPEIEKGTKYSIAMQMYMQEHGILVPNKENFYHIPPRPIIQPAINYYKAEIAKELGIAAKAAMNGENVRDRLSAAGALAQGSVQGWFINSANGWAPNAKSTIEGWMSPWGKFFPGKGFDEPLVNTGALRQAITYTVKKKGAAND